LRTAIANPESRGFEKEVLVANIENSGPGPERQANGGSSDRAVTSLLGIALVLLVFLSWGEVYIYWKLKQVSQIGADIEARSVSTQENLRKDMAKRIAELDRAYAQASNDVHADVMRASAGFASTRGELKRTRAMAEKLRVDQQKVASNLDEKLAAKADKQQLGSLSKDVSATRQDLSSTKQDLMATILKLGMTRSEFGTLIARNHDEIQQLRKLGERNYYEFALERSREPLLVGGVRLGLKKTNPKKLLYTMSISADDFTVEKKDRAANEPVYFFVLANKQPIELVVNRIENGRVFGYLSTPKETGAAETRYPRSSADGAWEPFQELKTKSK
jgi:hypothetical protein